MKEVIRLYFVKVSHSARIVSDTHLIDSHVIRIFVLFVPILKRMAEQSCSLHFCVSHHN